MAAAAARKPKAPAARKPKAPAARKPKTPKAPAARKHRAPKKKQSPFAACRAGKVRAVMHEFKVGDLRFARSAANPTGLAVGSRKQAVAVALAIARRKCAAKRAGEGEKERAARKPARVVEVKQEMRF
jgi:hypothetical protein